MPCRHPSCANASPPPKNQGLEGKVRGHPSCLAPVHCPFLEQIRSITLYKEAPRHSIERAARSHVRLQLAMSRPRHPASPSSSLQFPVYEATWGCWAFLRSLKYSSRRSHATRPPCPPDCNYTKLLAVLKPPMPSLHVSSCMPLPHIASHIATARNNDRS